MRALVPTGRRALLPFCGGFRRRLPRRIRCRSSLWSDLFGCPRVRKADSKAAHQPAGNDHDDDGPLGRCADEAQSLRGASGQPPRQVRGAQVLRRERARAGAGGQAPAWPIAEGAPQIVTRDCERADRDGLERCVLLSVACQVDGRGADAVSSFVSRRFIASPSGVAPRHQPNDPPFLQPRKGAPSIRRTCQPSIAPRRAQSD
jgi:hypothetical protein